jgi:hypothetical protein
MSRWAAAGAADQLFYLLITTGPSHLGLGETKASPSRLRVALRGASAYRTRLAKHSGVPSFPPRSYVATGVRHRHLYSRQQAA